MTSRSGATRATSCCPTSAGIGQTTLLEASARLQLRDRDPRAELVAASYLAAGGVGTLVIEGATAAQLAELAAHGPDTKLATAGEGRERHPPSAARVVAYRRRRRHRARVLARRPRGRALDGGRREPVTPIAIPHDVRAWVYAQAVAAYPGGVLRLPHGARRWRCGRHRDRVPQCADGDESEHPIAPDRGAETGFVIAGAELLQFARSFDTAHPPRIVYHSHTNGRAYFSELDRAMAAGPAYPVQHLVVGVALRTVTEAAQFAWSEAARDYVEVARWQP